MTISLQFETIPSTLPLFAQLAISKGLPDRKLAKALTASAKGIVATAAEVRRYIAVCGGEEREGLPILYPQVRSTPLTMALMAHPAFPLPALGLVHLENHVFQTRAPKVGEPIDYVVTIPAIQRTSRGYEFDMTTEASDSDGEVIWRSVARILSRAKDPKAPKAAREPRKPPQPSDWPVARSFKLDAAQGRRYARVSGDYNPIHLTAPTARLLGFKRAIIHGMWSAAAVAAELGTGEGACEFHCTFKTPLFLPGKGNLHVQSQGTQRDFVLHEAGKFMPILDGHYTEST